MKELKIKMRRMGIALMLVFTLFGCGKQEDMPTTEIKASSKESTEQVTTSESETGKGEEAEEIFQITSNGNSWENNGLTCRQFDGVIKNPTKEVKSGWKIVLKVPEGAKLENGWNGEYDLSGTSLTITAVDYNKEIPANGEITFGFILDTKGEYVPDGTLTMGENTYAVNKGVNKEEEATRQTGKTEADTEVDKETERSKDEKGTPFENHGKLSVKGTDLVDKNGKPFQLKGVSTHGLSWFPAYVNKEAFQDLAGYGVNAIRLAMYTDDASGYCNGGDQAQLKGLIETGVNACEELGMYAIIDWHILSDNDPMIHMEEAKTFFAETSKKYSGYDNVFYEICNEPNGGTNWETVKKYAETIIPIIREQDKDAIIIVGTPNWCQDVDVASANPIQGESNIMYAVHFYASTHKQDIRDKVETARKNGIAIIVSECSICDASGNGTIDYEEAEKWAELIEKDNLSFFAWNLSNKDEQSALLKSSVSKTSGFTQDDFSETGTWFMELCGK